MHLLATCLGSIAVVGAGAFSPLHAQTTPARDSGAIAGVGPLATPGIHLTPALLPVTSASD